MKKIFLLLLLALIFNPSDARAELFSIHFYYNAKTKTLNFDKLKSETVSYDKNAFLSISEFNNNQATGSYVLNLYDVTSSEALSTEFNPKEGSFNINIPYFSIASSLKVFEKSSGKEILSANLSSFTTCNGNGVCEIEKGENAINCISDCANSKPNFSKQTSNELKNNNGIIKDAATGETLLSDPALIPATSAPTTSSGGGFSIFILISGIFIFAGTIGFLVYKKFIKKD